MRTAGRIVLAVAAAAAVLGALTPAAGAATLVGAWKTKCPSYYYDVLPQQGGCNATAVPNPTGLTQLPTTITVSATNRGQTQGTTGAAYCALPTACPATSASTSRAPQAGAAQSTTQCIVPAGTQVLQTQALGSRRYRAGLLVIGWIFNPSGLSPGACTIAPALASIQLAKNGRSFVVSYTGFRRKVGQGYTYGPPFTFRVRYEKLFQGKTSRRR